MTRFENSSVSFLSKPLIMQNLRNRFFLYAGIWAVLLAACNNSAKTPDYTQQLIELNNRYDSALLKGDTAALGRLLAPEFTLVNPDGRLLNRQEQLLTIATSELKWEKAGSENVTVRFYGNTAVLLGEFKGNASYRGNPLAIQERYTTVWIRKDTSWQLVNEQANIVR